MLAAANLTVAPSPLSNPSYLKTQLSQVSLAPNSLFPVHQGGLEQQGPDCGSVITVGVSGKLVSTQASSSLCQGKETREGPPHHQLTKEGFAMVKLNSPLRHFTEVSGILTTK